MAQHSTNVPKHGKLQHHKCKLLTLFERGSRPPPLEFVLLRGRLAVRQCNFLFIQTCISWNPHTILPNLFHVHPTLPNSHGNHTCVIRGLLAELCSRGVFCFFSLFVRNRVVLFCGLVAERQYNPLLLHKAGAASETRGCTCVSQTQCPASVTNW